MANTIDTDTLRTWLDTGKPVTVLDIRGDDERAQWSIPGSLHANAYDALRGGSPGVLADIALPADRPVVTVCNAGRVSQAAADVLASRGFDAASLSGGMKAWSLAWNTADVPLAGTRARVIQVRRTGKGCLSYLVGSGGEAAVIDPSVPAQVYADVAKREGWRIKYVLDTHVHADHLSRARELARVTGAVLLLPPQERTTFQAAFLPDGGHVRVGDALLAAIHTPGHTDESTSLILDGAAVFTGDTLFTRGVGRPDLHASIDEARGRARTLFRSLERLRSLDPAMVVLPAHASEPVAFDGQAVASPLGDVSRWLADWLRSEEAFVARVTSNLPPDPPNFARIVAMNEAGEDAGEQATELEAGANRCAVT